MNSGKNPTEVGEWSILLLPDLIVVFPTFIGLKNRMGLSAISQIAVIFTFHMKVRFLSFSHAQVMFWSPS
jgi:hypothetical protein